MRQYKCNEFCAIVGVCDTLPLFEKYNYVYIIMDFHENAITILLLLASSSLSLPSTPAAFLIGIAFLNVSIANMDG